MAANDCAWEIEGPIQACLFLCEIHWATDVNVQKQSEFYGLGGWGGGSFFQWGQVALWRGSKDNFVLQILDLFPVSRPWSRFYQVFNSNRTFASEAHHFAITLSIKCCFLHGRMPNVLVRMLFIWFKFIYAVDLLTITSSHLTMLFWKSKWNFYRLLLGYEQHVNSHLMCGWSMNLNMFHCIHFITDWLNWFSKSYKCHVCVLWQVQWFRKGEVWHHLGHWGVLSKFLLNPAEIQNDTYPKQTASFPHW